VSIPQGVDLGFDLIDLATQIFAISAVGTPSVRSSSKVRHVHGWPGFAGINGGKARRGLGTHMQQEGNIGQLLFRVEIVRSPKPSDRFEKRERTVSDRSSDCELLAYVDPLRQRMRCSSR
jgi:hypothetical protein